MNEQNEPEMFHNDLESQRCGPWLRVAEPYWMQDVRIAQRAIQRVRENLTLGQPEPEARPDSEG